MLEKDGYISSFTKFLPDLFSSAIGAFVFTLAELLANSFTNHIGAFGVDRLFVPLVIGVVIFTRIKFEKYLFRNIHIGGDSYQVRTLTLPRVISPRTVLFIALYLAGAAYVWTQSVAFTVSSALILSIPLALLLVRFASPRFERLKSIQRNIVGEGVVLCFLAYGVFTYIQSMPLDVIQKGRYFIIYSALLLIAHAIYSSICDISTRDKVLEL